MFGKKAGMSMHQPGFEDIIILVVGIVIGIVLAAYLINSGRLDPSIIPIGLG